jgi:hypothetical protein
VIITVPLVVPIFTRVKAGITPVPDIGITPETPIDDVDHEKIDPGVEEL